MFTIETVAVLGASEGGTACAVLAALGGCTVRLHDASDAAIASACEAVLRRVDRAFAARVNVAARTASSLAPTAAP